jgi:hypothetical protein
VRAAILSLLALAAAVPARAARAADEIDDPKLARRLTSRITLAAPTGAADTLALAPAPAVEPLAAAPRRAPAAAAVSDGGAREPGVSAAIGVSVAPAPGIDRDARAAHAATRTPVIGLGYRRFSFVQLGATTAGTAIGTAASEPFDSLSLDYYPVSRSIRFGLSTQYGWQSGRLSGGSGDYFIAQSASLGVQLPGPTVTPFAEAFAGGGYLRRFQFDHTIPTAYWQFGVDAGASFFLGDHGFVSLALGYLRPVNGFLREQSFTSVYVDTWSFKLGIGL